MTRAPRCIAAIATTAALASGAALAEASPGSSPDLVYGCKTGQIWQTPGHQPVGLIVRGTAFKVIRYSPSKRWALGISRPASTRYRHYGWVRHAALCRTRPV